MTGQPPLWQRVLQSLPAWAAAAAAGAAADFVGVPLAWVLGPMIAAAGFSIAGQTVLASVESRRAGQLLVGTAIGLNMTTAAAARLPLWLPLMIGAALLSIAISAALSFALARAARVDRATAYFALLPGGLSEMANVGATFGARSEAVSLSHALRVALAVLLVPGLVAAIDASDRAALSFGRPIATPSEIALLAGAALIGTFTLRFMKLSNPWMLGALAGAGILAGSGLIEARLPPPVLWLGQFLIGLAIGTRFKRDILRQLPRFALMSTCATLVLGATMILLAETVHVVTPVDFPSLVLALSPGGFAEMALTAQSLHLDIAIVTGFHFVRAFVVNSVAGPIWALQQRR